MKLYGTTILKEGKCTIINFLIIIREIMKVINRSMCNLAIRENGIVKLCVLLMCISSILQSSMIFGTWTILINACKYLIPVLGVLVLILKAEEVNKK